jgi:hypothetical protein
MWKSWVGGGRSFRGHQLYCPEKLIRIGTRRDLRGNSPHESTVPPLPTLPGALASGLQPFLLSAP